MKRIFHILAPLAALALSSGILLADGGYSFDFKVEPAKAAQDEKKVEDKLTTVSEKWMYKVSIENHSFKDLSNLEVKYVVFVKPDAAGEKNSYMNALKRHTGTTTIASFKNLDAFKFTTDPVTISRTTLEGGWMYTNGASSYSREVMKGIWIRIFSNGQQIGEYVTPSEIATKEKFDGN